VKEALAKSLGDYFRDQGAEFAYLFGSQATGKAVPESDFDFAALMPEPWDPMAGFEMAARMERDLSRICGGSVDLVYLNQASPLLFFEVIRNGKVLHSVDEERRIRMELRARGAYEDYVHIQSFFVQAMKENLAS
jgi:predicted nucleotidyltransferase